MRLLIALLALLALAIAAPAAYRTQANVSVEIAFTAKQPHADPFNEVDLDVIFTDPAGKEFRVPAFWDGGDVWKVRYASPLQGIHSFRTQSNDANDRGLNGIQGTVSVEPYAGKNELFKRGPVRVATDNRHLAYADGKPFFWLGDTWWMGLAKRLQWPNEFQALTKNRVEKGFTVVQIVAGLYPDMPPFDPRGANEAGYPWEPDYARINPAYFDKADVRLRYLVENGITPCIVGSWGYYMTWMSVEQLERHWRNLIARYGSMPVVWCGCGEVDMPWYLSKRGEYNRQDRMDKWTEVVRYIHRTDPFHRLLTLHPDGASARNTINDASLLDFDMLQTGHGLADAAEAADKSTKATYGASPKMPFVNGESSYENLSNQIPAFWTRATFWISMLNGAAGHTYGANGIWQNNRPGDPHGKSPAGNNWGTMSSSEAMHLPGSSQESYGKKLFEKYPWQHFQPHPEWASYQASGDSFSLEGSHWIWFPEGNPAVDAPVEARYFRAIFNVPSGKRVVDARLALSADDAAIAYLNGDRIGESKDWHAGSVIGDFVQKLKKGPNILAVRAENLAANVSQNPAGLISALEIRFDDGTVQVIRSDETWRASKVAPPGWSTPEYQDQGWEHALRVGTYGADPWGRVGSQAFRIGPNAAGISGGVRMLYILESKPVVIRQLGSGRRYSVKLFDPVTGKSSNLGLAKADSSGNWLCNPPAGWDHDWVLILEPYREPISPVVGRGRPSGRRR